MYSVKIGSEIHFACEPGESVLDAAARAGFTLAYSCRTGRCSTCRCKMVQGKSAALHPELGLTEAEIADGWVLSCVRTPLTDLVLEGEGVAARLPPVRTVPCRIQAMEGLANGVLRVVLRLPATSEFDFIPGQYVNVIGHGGVRRSYSLANASLFGKCIELHVREVPGGVMSGYWFYRAKVGDLLRINGPLGTFFLRDLSGLHLIFLATGTGIAPVVSMLGGLERLPIEQRPASVSVYWGGRRRSDLYVDLTSSDLSHGVPYAFVPVLSRPDRDWTGSRGYVQHELLARHPDLSQSVVYACGSESMIHGARQLLISSGLPTRRFMSDAFVCSAAAS